jgi:3-hydroxyacyl-[acyl-carrier-protein] dehydratase
VAAAWRVELMRWFWIDRFVEFVRGKRAVAIKNVAMTEEQLDGYAPGFQVMPASLMIEGMAQTAGLLIGEISGFQQRVVLAKVAKAVFHGIARPGDTLRYTAVVQDVKGDGAMCSITGHIGETLLAEVELMFAFLDDRFPGGPLFEPVDFVATLMNFQMYDVGRTPDGERIEVPPFYAEAVRAAQAGYDPIPGPVEAAE